MGALEGKVAIVTGGTSGIGEGIAALFVEEGAKVVVAARRADEGAALEKRLGVRFVRTDVANEADVKAMIDRTVGWFGRVDCLVNNAALPAPMVSITEIDAATIDQLLAVNVRGVLLGIKHVAPVMLKQGSRRRGLQGRPFDRCDKRGIRVGANDPACRAARRHRASGRLSCRRRFELHQRPGHRGRWRPLERDQRLVVCRRHARRNVKTPQRGSGEALGTDLLAKELLHRLFGSTH